MSDEPGSEGDLLQRVLDDLPGLLCVVDREGFVLYANRAMISLCCGGDGGILVGEPAGEALGPLPQALRDSLFTALREGGRVRVSVTWDGGGGEPLVIAGEAFSLPVNGGESPSLAVLNARVMPAEEPAREVEAIAASRRKARELLTVVRHDILNQLTILIGFLQFSEDFISDPQLEEFIAKEERAGENIQALIEFTRDFQDMLTEDPRWISLASLVESARNMTDAGNISIGCDVGCEEVFGSPLIRHVIYTLLKNAIDHAAGLTRITLSTSRVDGDLILACGDDGAGIPEDERKALFDRGHGRNRGFGLWLAREILAISGATLDETGGAGGGARFEIRIPQGMWRDHEGA